MREKKKPAESVCRELPGGLRIEAKTGGLEHWVVKVLCTRPLESICDVSSREEALCLVSHLERKYECFQELLEQVRNS